MKVPKLIILTFLLGFLILSVYADELNPLIYQYNNPEITVVFSEPLQTTPDRQQSIADEIAGVTPSIIYPNPANPDNILCTLFGHKLADPVTVTATYHKVDPHQPRCLLKAYDVTYCTRCDYTDTVQFDEFYVFCCPED